LPSGSQINAQRPLIRLQKYRKPDQHPLPKKARKSMTAKRMNAMTAIFIPDPNKRLSIKFEFQNNGKR